MFIGTYDSYGPYRTIVNFDTTALDGLEITSAKFKIYNHHSYSCTKSSWVLEEVNSRPSDTTWNTKPENGTYVDEYDGTLGYSSSCADGYVYADSDKFTADGSGLGGWN